MDHDDLVALHARHAAWRLLRADNAPLVLSFLGAFFTDSGRGATGAAEVVDALDDHLYALNRGAGDEEATSQGPLYPRAPSAYLDEWAGDGRGWLRRFYPTGADEVHYDPTPAFEKAYAWVTGLGTRPFVGTESRLQTVVDLLRQLVHGSEADPDARLVELRRRREALDVEIAAAEAGQVTVLDETQLRERYQLVATTARELLADFREVEDNFRNLDRAARERIASWTGGKGDLLADLVGTRSDIAGSDQGRSFQAFYDFLLSESRQSELSELLARVQRLDAVDTDPRLRSVHHDWSDAAERTQATVRQISEQLRRFLDDQVWIENRRVLELVRSIESAALARREAPPETGLVIDEIGLDLALPFERPLYDPRPTSRVDSLLAPDAAEDVDVAALLSQEHVDPTRLLDRIRAVVPERSSTLLTEILELYPPEQGVAEIVAYLSLAADDVDVTMDEGTEMVIDLPHPDNDDGSSVEPAVRRVRLPRVTVTRP